MALFLGAWALFLPQSLARINVFDEGFIVSGAMLVLDGRLPYRDFLSMYGPGQYYLTAALFALFGEQLLVVRLAHGFILAGLAVIVFVIAKDFSKHNRNLPFVVFFIYIGVGLFAKPSVGYPAITATLLLLMGALALGKWVVESKNWILLLSSVAVGSAGLFRWDFGVFGLSVMGFTVLVNQFYTDASGPQRFKVILLAAVPALAIAAVVYIPLLAVFSDPARWYQEVLHFSLFEFSKWRNLELIRPSYWGLMSALQHGGSAHLLYQSVLKLSYPILPAILAIGTLGLVGHSIVRGDRKLTGSRASVQAIFLALVSVLLLNQMRVRPSLWQGFPALVASLPLLAYLIDNLKTRIASSPHLSAVVRASGFLAGAALLHVALQGFLAAVDDRLIELNTPRSTNVRVEADRASYVDLVNYIRANTQTNEAIYSGVMDHTRLFVNDAMLYFLTDRVPADRFLELEPGIANTRPGQTQIINALKDKGVQLIVLADITSNEPNLTSKSNGIDDLDRYIHDNYQLVKSFGKYTVFLRKQS